MTPTPAVGNAIEALLIKCTDFADNRTSLQTKLKSWRMNPL